MQTLKTYINPQYLIIVSFVIMESKLQHPFTAIVAGPTGSGKTQFCLKLVKHCPIEPPPQRIIWCYGVWQEAFDSVDGVEFYEGMPEMSLFDKRIPTLLILDDLMMDVSDTTVEIFTRGSHHSNISVVYITQNLFSSGKQNRTISLNTHYIVAFKNPRDNTQIGVLARQMFPRKWKYMMDAFGDATSIPYSYLFIDLKPTTDDRYRLRSGIFPDETNYIYVHK